MRYRLFQPSYTRKADGHRVTSPTYHIAFKDHAGRRQTFAGEIRERDTQHLAAKLMELVRCRKSGEQTDAKMVRLLAGA